MRSISRDQFRALLAAAKAKRERDWLIILVTYNHGLRASEIVGPKGFQRDAVRDGFLTICRLKGSLRTVQALVDDPDPLFSERQALIAYATKSSFGGPVFKITRQRYWQLMREHGEAAGIPHHLLFPHVLKHSIAMHSIEKAGIQNVRQHLGHKSGSSTMEYLKVSDEAASKAVMDAVKGVQN